MADKIDQPTRKIANHPVPLVGLGCMGMSDFYGGASEAQSIATLHHALDVGVTHWDTADMYGPHTNERLLSRVLAERRGEVFLATKFGVVRDPDSGAFLGVNGKPEYVRQSCLASLERLGVDQIDLYYQHRPDLSVPVDETISAMAELVSDGLVKSIGVSEFDADRLRAAHAVHPIAAYQGELSIWTREHEENGVIAACEELGITFVAYSPLGRGFLTGSIKSREDLDENDWRRNNPRFSEENFGKNLELVETVAAIANDRGVSPAQVALAWVLGRYDHVVSIPGTTKKHRVEENAGAAGLNLTDEEMARLDALPQGAGNRYG
jgi:aryl-alcohol dehydrogenase-like predicted oxidoreductase